MPMKICSFCGRDIQEGETHRLQEFLDTVEESMKTPIAYIINDIARQAKSDPNCICSACFDNLKNSE